MNRVKDVLKNSAFGLLIALQAFSGSALAAPSEITRVSGISVPNMSSSGPSNVILGMIYNAPTTFGVSLQDASVYDPIAIPQLCLDDGTCTSYPDPIQGVFHFNLASYGVNRSATWVTQGTFPNFPKNPVMTPDQYNGQYLKNVSLRGYAYNEGIPESRTVSMTFTLNGTKNLTFIADQYQGTQNPIYTMRVTNVVNGWILGEYVGYRPAKIHNLNLGAGTYKVSLTSTISSDVVLALWVNNLSPGA
jgi:hypothetical protein